MIKIVNISKKYENDLEPIHNLNAVINRGDVIAVIGPSGTGKSTFLRCLNMLDPPTEGDIYFQDEKITEKGYDLIKLRKRVGMVFQSFNLFNHMTVIENIMLPQMRLLKRDGKEAYKRGMGLLEQVGLTDFYLQYPGQLSGGQKQRVAIARAMAMDPEVLLLDEPTSALDPTMVDEVNEVIEDLASSGITILIVTHDMAFARDISSRIFYMDEGIIYEEGTPEEIFENPKKDKTLQFVKKLFVLEEEILSRDYDFELLVKKIYKQMTQMKSIGNIWHNSVLLLDELINNVLFLLLEDPLHIHLRMECKKDSIVLNVEYGGTELDLKSLLLEKAKSPVGTEEQDDWLPVSARIICSYAEDMTYTRQEGELRNCIRIVVSEAATKERKSFASRQA